MRKLHYLLVLVLSVFAVNAFSQGLDYNEKLIFDPGVRVGKLDNGITYYIKANVLLRKEQS